MAVSIGLKVEKLLRALVGNQQSTDCQTTKEVRGYIIRGYSEGIAMWLTRFETCVLDDALERVRSKDDAQILANMVFKLTDWTGVNRVRLDEDALMVLIWCEAKQTKHPSFGWIINTIERLHLHREDRERGRLSAKALADFEEEFEGLFKNPAWESFTYMATDDVITAAIDSLTIRLRSFMPDVKLPNTVAEQVTTETKSKVQKTKKPIFKARKPKA